MNLADLASSREVLERAPLLSEAALGVASRQVRHMGTLGGNLAQENRCFYYNQTHAFQFVAPCFKRGGDFCYFVPKGKKCWAVNCSDTAPALISLDARLNIQGPEKTRRLPLESFYTGDAQAPRAISRDEVVTEVVVPAPAPVRGSGFAKFTLRGGMEFAALTVAVVLDSAEGDQNCHAARITVGSVSATPVRAFRAEQMLLGQSLSEDICREAARIVASEVQIISHHGYSATYLKACLEAEAGRALHVAAEGILLRELSRK
jgi:CO/xanthine dehydrogenase FAD-binding subunit